MDDKGSVGKISVSSDSVSTLNSEDFVLVSRLGDDTPSSTNNGSDDEKTGLKVRMSGSAEERREISEILLIVIRAVKHFHSGESVSDKCPHSVLRKWMVKPGIPCAAIT